LRNLFSDIDEIKTHPNLPMMGRMIEKNSNYSFDKRFLEEIRSESVFMDIGKIGWETKKKKTM
jgi:hypothetical protein